ncbi:unnamed protein product, partial [Ectocarpus sp. 12 AP-2014]
LILEAGTPTADDKSRRLRYRKKSSCVGPVSWVTSCTRSPHLSLYAYNSSQSPTTTTECKTPTSKNPGRCDLSNTRDGDTRDTTGSETTSSSLHSWTQLSLKVSISSPAST